MQKIIIGTRKSPLALYQAYKVRDEIVKNNPNIEVELLLVTTTGDKVQDRFLSEIGGKALFTKEIDQALLNGQCDIAVHSLKDLETIVPYGLKLVSTLPRASVNDAFISRTGACLNDMPKGSLIGTASMRRKVLLQRVRPDFEIKLIRGNVGSRIDKLKSGEYDGIVLAKAGLERLKLSHLITEVLSEETFIPAVCQGVIAVVANSDKPELIEILSTINCQETFFTSMIEREFLMKLSGTCETPTACYAKINSANCELIDLKLFSSSVDGSNYEEFTETVSRADAIKVAGSFGEKLKGK